MECNRIEFIQTDELREPIEHKDSFCFRKDRPYHLMQKACIWILRRLKAYDTGIKTTYTRHTIDTTSFMECLFKQQDHLSDILVDRRASRLLIGAQDFEEMMESDEIRRVISFRAEYCYGKKILGLKVEVIPWMKGMLVMP